MQAKRPSLLRDSDFIKLLTGQSISELGSQVTMLALPLVAILTLHAGPLQVGALEATSLAPFILVGLPAGVWVDRLARRRPILIAADLGRLLAMASIPVAATAGRLILPQLYVVGFVSGVLTVFFDVAYQSYLPALVSRQQLVEGNAKLEFTRSGAQMSGPAVAGSLVGAVGGPLALAADAASFGVSVLSLLAIRQRELPAVHLALRASMRADIAAGLRFVLHHPLLRPIAMCTSTWNLFGNMYFALLVLFCVRELRMTPTTIGLAFSIGSVGAPIGAVLASRISRALGAGPTIVLSAALGSSGLLVALAPASQPVPFLVLATFLGGVGVVYNITQVSLRQAICPPAFQGRMNATMRFLVWGTIPIGSIVGGALGAALGLRTTMIIGSAGTLLAMIPVALSPVRSLRTIEEAVPPELAAGAAPARPGDIDADATPPPGAIAPPEQLVP